MSTTNVPATLDVLREWFCTHGIPEQIVTDNGSQFTAEAFKAFTQCNGIRHVRSAPYHPSSNGLAERFVQSLKASLRASLNDGRPLAQRLSSYLLTYRTTAHATTGVPPCQLLLNRELRTRFSLLQPSHERSVLDKQALQKSAHDRRAYSRKWIVGDRVMARSLRPGPDCVPAVITEVLGPVTYVVETAEGLHWKRHADQLKDWLPPVSLEDPDRVSEETRDSVAEDLPIELSMAPAESASDETAETDAENSASPPESSSSSHPTSVERQYPH